MTVRQRMSLIVCMLFLISLIPLTLSSDIAVDDLKRLAPVPSDIDFFQVLPDPELNSTPTVTINGTSDEFNSSYHEFVSPDTPSYIELNWTHVANTSLDFNNNPDYSHPECYDFIYFSQSFDWLLNERPADAILELYCSINATEDFASVEGEDMYRIFAWLIDSSGNWRRIMRSSPYYHNTYIQLYADLNYFDLYEGWEGMVEDEYGVQEDPTDILTLAIALSPTSDFENYYSSPSEPWREFNGTVSLHVANTTLTVFREVPNNPETTLTPMFSSTPWGMKASDVFPEIDPSHPNNNANDRCKSIVTDDDGFVYVLVSSRADYAFYAGEDLYFSYLTILKYDARMNLIWVKQHDNFTYAGDICVKDGFLYAVGYNESNVDLTKPDLLLTKWTTDGDIVWTTVWDGGMDERGLAVGVSEYGSIFVTVSRNRFAEPPLEHFEILLAKFDSNGVFQWNFTTYTGVISDIGSITVVSDGIYVHDGGYILSFRNFSGTELWSCICDDYVLDADENLYTCKDNSHVYISFQKFDDNQTLIWENTFSKYIDEYWSVWLYHPLISIAPNGSLIISAQYYRFTDDFFVIRISNDGDVLWSKTIETQVTNYLYDIDIAETGIAYVLGPSQENYDVAVDAFEVGEYWLPTTTSEPTNATTTEIPSDDPLELIVTIIAIIGVSLGVIVALIIFRKRQY